MQIDYIKRRPFYSKEKIIASLNRMEKNPFPLRVDNDDTISLSNKEILITIDRQYIDVVYLGNPSKAEKKTILNKIIKAATGC